mmetsp:Transcript_61535/g.179852  ORF Transcript_61535/g.179852 Transcript_61535/m.179852 type:complete len:204 (-) Transcript_61535:50-661(-)
MPASRPFPSAAVRPARPQFLRMLGMTAAAMAILAHSNRLVFTYAAQQVWARAPRLPQARRDPRASRAAGDASSAEGPAERIGELLLDAARLAPCRFIVIGPTIMEATADLRAGQAQIHISQRPSGGGPLVTLASPDKRFEVHVDASAVVEATLGVSEKTGKGILRLLSAERRPLLTVILVGNDAQTHFEVLFGRWGGSVRFHS